MARERRNMNKPKRQRQQHDDIWNLMVEACGGLCCVCREQTTRHREDKPLQRGHIQRHADGGSGEIENLIPICATCNGKHSRGPYTPDTLPGDLASAVY